MDILKIDEIKSEYNFLKFPFFDLSGVKKDRIEFHDSKVSKDSKTDIFWKVSRGIDANLPGTLSRKIHLYLESLLSSLKKPIPALIKLGSLRDIAKNIGITEDSGKNLSLIKLALKSIAFTTIEAKGTFKLKDTKSSSFFDGCFHLYDGVFFTGESLPDGSKADSVYVLLSQVFISNFNNSFTIPIDINLLKSLEGDISSRLYELLTIWFYPLFKNNLRFIDKQYSLLCMFGPFIRQPNIKRAKKQLHKAHLTLQKKGIIANNPPFSRLQENDWLIRYLPGETAKAWYQKHNLLFIPENEKSDLTITNDVTHHMHPLMNSLKSLGIQEKKAQKILNNSDESLIQDWINILNQTGQTEIQNKAGFIVKAIEEKWFPPNNTDSLQSMFDQYSQAKKEAINNFLSSFDSETLKKKAMIKFTDADPHFEWTPVRTQLFETEFRSNLTLIAENRINFPSFDDWYRSKKNLQLSHNL